MGIHSADLVHRDIKPANVLVNKDCDVKICDFGLARAGCAPGVTDYVVTRWWRAPEVVLLPSKYTALVDIWSVGCILAELLGRTPIFRGKDYLDQIWKIFEVVGTPSGDDLSFLPPDAPARRFIEKTAYPKKEWSSIFPLASKSAIEALEKMLCVNPQKRADAKSSIMLEYFKVLHQPEDLRVANAAITCEHDRMAPTQHWLRNAMYAEMCHYHKDMAKSRVIQLHASQLAADGTLAVSCCGMSGDELTKITAEPGQDISAIRATLSRQLDEPLEFLQLLTADGRLLNRCDAEEHQEARMVLAAC